METRLYTVGCNTFDEHYDTHTWQGWGVVNLENLKKKMGSCGY
jgi:hypothetical protein